MLRDGQTDMAECFQQQPDLGHTKNRHSAAQPGATACGKCAAGFFSEAAGAYKCSKCTPGSYTGRTGQTVRVCTHAHALWCVLMCGCVQVCTDCPAHSSNVQLRLIKLRIELKELESVSELTFDSRLQCVRECV